MLQAGQWAATGVPDSGQGEADPRLAGSHAMPEHRAGALAGSHAMPEHRAGALAGSLVPAAAVVNFDELVERYQAPLLRFLYGLVGDREQAADLAQETFLSAFRSLGRLPADARLDAWLYTIALNHARGVLRRRRLLRWVPFLVSVHDRAAGRDLASGVALHQQLQEVLDQLPTDQRACVLLHAEGFRYAEIGKVLGC